MKKTERRRERPATRATGKGADAPKAEASKRRTSTKSAQSGESGNNLSMSEIEHLIELISEKQFNEFELERGDFKLRLMKGVGRVTVHQIAAEAPELIEHSTVPAPTATPVVTPQTSTPAAAPAPREENLHIVTSPIVGTFYRSPSPSAPSFVNVGDTIEEGKVVCIIEAMKLMNEIPSDVSGRIEKIFVENGQPVEFGQALFGIKK